MRKNNRSSMFPDSMLNLSLWTAGMTFSPPVMPVSHVLISVSCNCSHMGKLGWQSLVPVSSYANDIEKEFQAWKGFASSQLGLLSIIYSYFLTNRLGFPHQLLNVSVSQGPLHSSATLGNVTRRSSVRHKLSKIIDACNSFSSFFVPWTESSRKSLLLIIQHGWAEPGCLLVSLILANQMKKDREVVWY